MKSILLTRFTACELKVTTVTPQLFFHFIIYLQKTKEAKVVQFTHIDKESFHVYTAKTPAKTGENPKLLTSW